MQHMILINPPRRKSGHRSVSSPTRTRGAFGGHWPTLFVRNPKSKTTMAKSRRTRRARVRRNPPKMTAARRALISRKIRALHRSGKYRSQRRAKASSPAPTRRRRRSISRAITVRRSSSVYSPRRRTIRRRSGGMVGGGMLGLKSLVAKDNLMMAGGALGGTLLVNFVAAKVTPMLPNSYARNAFVQAGLKLATGAATAKLVSRYSRPAAQGILIGTMITVASDAMQNWMRPSSPASAGTSQYLGGGRSRQRGMGMAQYLGAAPRMAPKVGRNVTSLVGPVNPTAATFAQPRSGGVGALYGNTGAFKSDAWSRSR